MVTTSGICPLGITLELSCQMKVESDRQTNKTRYFHIHSMGIKLIFLESLYAG